jgi:hypothetical protein
VHATHRSQREEWPHSRTLTLERLQMEMLSIVGICYVCEDCGVTAVGRGTPAVSVQTVKLFIVIALHMSSVDLLAYKIFKLWIYFIVNTLHQHGMGQY